MIIALGIIGIFIVGVWWVFAQGIEDVLKRRALDPDYEG